MAIASFFLAFFSRFYILLGLLPVSRFSLRSLQSSEPKPLLGWSPFIFLITYPHSFSAYTYTRRASSTGAAWLGPWVARRQLRTCCGTDCNYLEVWSALFLVIKIEKSIFSNLFFFLVCSFSWSIYEKNRGTIKNVYFNDFLVLEYNKNANFHVFHKTFFHLSIIVFFFPKTRCKNE